MTGTIVNTIAIIIGGTLGRFLGDKLTDSIKDVVMQGLSLAVLLIGLQMALKANQIILVIFSLVIGGIIGELLKIETKLEQIGIWLEKTSGQKGEIVTGFVQCSLIYCIGAMAIMGAIQDGLQNNPATLYAKSLLDGFSAIAFSSTLGIGVILSAFSVLIYQGSITLLASSLKGILTPTVVNEMTATGGLLIIGIAFNILELTNIKVGNLLPAVFINVILVTLV
ncbi:uncharacterized membrane protein, possible Na+ channel or pump [Halobacteroides halobius DSM 5150]|uniref:Uncharacterized membrane protein, possible Na+ channel or pump n=1 Tax=Halobacteroides halobius (strain ATCC 35273 / DSM 5150 / MD-1) TaxID=748449 RepID=L0KB14_HALHC|nr:DUF554 domain-containing protein [Halobacteroides halobius]AGB42492.1 uncharacterized membrane protein, possible Na+ channel or pump [Halobacteroides halobius DSM 5150]